MREHEVRDPVHGFVRYGADERKIIDSLPVQRLRSIHQLATTYLVYPGASHKRFEHSLGTMELASRIYEVITSRAEALINNPIPKDPGELDYWHRVVRLAGLLHDVGHLPFSHAAEKELLPPGYSHAFRLASSDPARPGHEPARRFLERGHYRLLYSWNAQDARQNPDIAIKIHKEASQRFGENRIRLERYPAKSATVDFPTRLIDGRVVSAASISDVFARVPPAKFEFVFASPDCVKAAGYWLKKKLPEFLEEGGSELGSLGA